MGRIREKLGSRGALLPWLLVALQPLKWVWAGVEQIGQVQTLMDIGRWGPPLFTFVRDWGWVLGLGWLGFLVLRDAPTPRAPKGRRVSSPKIKTVEESKEEKEQIQTIRTLWELHGERPTDRFQRLHGNILRRLREKVYWAPLLKSQGEMLQRSILAVNGSLAHNSTMDVAEVRERFNEMLVAYLEAIRWIYQTAVQGDIDLPDGYLEQWLRPWSEDHHSFRYQLNALETIPGHKGTLSRHLDYCEDAYLVNLVRKAE